MSAFATKIRPHVAEELERAAEAEGHGDAELAFHHLERAHVLGQSVTREHVRAHWAMLRWGVRHGQPREVAGQVLRIVGDTGYTPGQADEALPGMDRAEP